MNQETRLRRGSKTLIQTNSSVRVATEKLVRHLNTKAGSVDGQGRRLAEQLLDAAARTEQALRDQRERIRYLEDLSITDELTGLMNRRGFGLELERALARADRQGETGVLLLCDLDGFKAINDTLGHPAGDKVLKEVSNLLHRATRRSDVVARLGGDEFAILMPATSPARAAARLLDLEAAIEDHRVTWNGHGIRVSASFGLQPYDGESRPETLIALADRALYRCKGPKVAKRIPPAAELGSRRRVKLAVAGRAG